jgi:hypothetical protein
MPEKFRGKQFVGERAGVYRHEIFIATFADAVNGLGDQLLAAAAFAPDQYAVVGLGDFFDHLKHFDHVFILGNNIFKGKMTVQAARPAYSTTYDSPLMNFQDDNLVFKYQEFQPIEFNENRVQGNDPMVGNLTATLAFYVNMILGFDYDSYLLRGGDMYFQKAWNIVNNAPDGRDITGWKSFESLRNRYWLAENMNNNRFALIHDAIYSYYRSGIDVFFENEDAGRSGIINCLNFLNSINS